MPTKPNRRRRRTAGLPLLLTEFREERKLSQQKMAELFEISQVEYCRIETGERRPTPALAARIQKVTGFSLAFLLGVE